jgi:hypothetical protein
MKFKEWFNSNLVVGQFPIKQNEHFEASIYDVVINVSDEFYLDVENELKSKGCSTYWFPMNECKKDIGLNSIYGAMVILYEAERLNKRVYLHCHAGVNRSVSVQAAYYYMRTGSHVEKIRGGFINMLVANCGRGYLPPKSELEQFLNKINDYLSVEMQGGILDSCKLGVINNF